MYLSWMTVHIYGLPNLSPDEIEMYHVQTITSGCGDVGVRESELLSLLVLWRVDLISICLVIDEV